MQDNHILPVILCGGQGTRLWPLSRQTFPKQFLPFNYKNNNSLLQNTYKRIEKIQNIQDPMLICNEEHRFIVAEQMREIGIKPNSIILEPFGRNTAPAITIAALKSMKNGGDPNLLILSSDHEIENEKEFIKVVESGVEFSKMGNLVTFGIIPNAPETGYGYIKSKKPIYKSSTTGSKIERFFEKPNKKKAKIFIEDSRFTWNSGIFLFKASVILEEINYFFPELINLSKRSLEKSIYDLDFQRLEKNSFSKCPNISIDLAVMENTNKGYVIPLNAGWNDVGSWDAVWKISKKNKEGNFIKGNVHTINSKNCYLRSENRLIASIGIENLIIIETFDAILIANKESAQDVKILVDELKNSNISEGLEHKKIYRPWGDYLSLINEKNWQVKLIKVKPGGKLSLQKHHHRSENWIVVNGTAKVEIDGKESILHENQSAYLPLGCVHRLSNPGKIELKIIEVQTGSYLGEDDIERFEDEYGRIK